jgi:predicted nucleic acid-binding protein
LILLDTNVVVDVVLDRAPHAAGSSALLELLERRGRMAFVSWHTLSNLYYLTRPLRGPDAATAFLERLTSFALVAPGDTETFRFATSLELPDLEDAMQVAAAWSCGARFIATRNTKDFKRSPVPARTPEQLLKELT